MESTIWGGGDLLYIKFNVMPVPESVGVHMVPEVLGASFMPFHVIETSDLEKWL